MTTNPAILLDQTVKEGGQLQVKRAAGFPLNSGPRWELVVYEPVPDSDFPRRALRITASTPVELIAKWMERIEA
jgi:hypothetical protein